MKNEMDALAPGTGRMEMKDKTVQEIFSGRPYHKTQHKIARKTGYANVVGKGQVAKEKDRWNINKQGNGKMNFGERLHPIAPEHSCRFFTIGFIIFHAVLF